MLKRQKNPNRDISKAPCLLDFFPVLIFLWPLPVLHLARHSFSEGGSSKSRFDKLKAPSPPRGDGGAFGICDFSA
jgi:hypothetical protein